MSAHTVRVFISHSWRYSEHYDRLASWIFDDAWRSGQATIYFHDYSIPKTHPVHNARSAYELRNAIYNHIAPCHVVVIPMGMYASYSNWIKEEIARAGHYQKPILAVNPRGHIRGASVVRNAAHRTVGWNRESVLSAIWDLHFRGV